MCQVLLPMLLIPSESESKGNTNPTNYRLVYSISERKVHTNFTLRVLSGERCCGSSHGWLATTDLADLPMIIALVNSFRKEATIRLQNTTRILSRIRFEVCTVADPKLNPDNSVVAALYGN